MPNHEMTPAPADLSDGIIRATVGPESPYLVGQLPEEYEAGDQYADVGEWDLPSPGVVPRVVTALKQLLAANDLDAAQVVFSGYDRLEPPVYFESSEHEHTRHTSSAKEVGDAQTRIVEINTELAHLHEDGILSEARRQEAREEIAALGARIRALKNLGVTKEERVVYCFAPLAALEEQSNVLSNNSVYYAGGEKGATIGVYDRQALARLESDSAEAEHLRLSQGDHAGNIYIVDATRPQFESTKIAELAIHYAQYNDYDQRQA